MRQTTLSMFMDPSKTSSNGLASSIHAESSHRDKRRRLEDCPSDGKGIIPTHYQNSRSKEQSLSDFYTRIPLWCLENQENKHRHLRSSPFNLRGEPSIYCIRRGPHDINNGDVSTLSANATEAYTTCITDIAWDNCDDFAVVLHRRVFHLFDTKTWCNPNSVNFHDSQPVLQLCTDVLRERTRAANRISFGFSWLSFCGTTLDIVCGYSSAPFIDVFDLEDVDEATGAPLCSYDLSSITFPMEDTSTRRSPSTTCGITISDSVSVAALTNGCSVLIDRRTSRPSVCTGSPPRFAAISQYETIVNRQTDRGGISALDLLNRTSASQLLTGTKSGCIELWDLRMQKSPIFFTRVASDIGSIKSGKCSAERCGAPEIWISSCNGDIFSLLVGSSSFCKKSKVSTGSGVASQMSSNFFSPKISLLPQNDLLLFPHTSSNSLLMYDISSKRSSQNRNICSSSGKCGNSEFLYSTTAPQSPTHNFKSALLLLQSSSLDCESSESNEESEALKEPPLIFSLSLQTWCKQVSCISPAQRCNVVAIGGESGDIQILTD